MHRLPTVTIAAKYLQLIKHQICLSVLGLFPEGHKKLPASGENGLFSGFPNLLFSFPVL